MINQALPERTARAPAADSQKKAASLRLPMKKPENSVMSLKHEFNRIAHLFDDGVEKTGKQAGHWLEKGARELKRRTRHQVDTGRHNAVSVEESIVRHMRENPSIYIIGAALLIGALIARLILASRREPQPPFL